MKLTDDEIMVLGLGAVAIVAVGYISSKGVASVASDAGQAAGQAVVAAANGVAVGAVTGVSEGLGIPTPSETITDPAQCKAYIDANGYWSGFAQCSAPAFAKALTM